MWLFWKASCSLMRWPGKAKLLVTPLPSKAGGYGAVSIGEEEKEYKDKTISGPSIQYIMAHFSSVSSFTLTPISLLLQNQTLHNLKPSRKAASPWAVGSNAWRSSVINVSGSRWKVPFSCCKRPWRTDVSPVFLFFNLPDTKPNNIHGLEHNKEM